MEAEDKGLAFPGRWKPVWIDHRLKLEARRLTDRRGIRQSDGIYLPFHYKAAKLAIKAAGLYARGYRNFKDVRIRRMSHFLPGWPPPLDGLRVLQLSDLHIDLDEALLPIVCQALQGLDFELAVMTGDFIESDRERPVNALPGLRMILESVGTPSLGRYGVLGNHDSLWLAAELEAMGLPILVNEAVVLSEGHAAFALAGVDDAFFFRSAAVNEAAAQCPPELPRILLSHSPQVAPAAREAGFSLMLSGHTHGGQICLPGGYSLVTMEEVPQPLFSGAWRQGSLAGYTSTGTGACHLPIRFNCPPEMIIHVICSADRLTISEQKL